MDDAKRLEEIRHKYSSDVDYVADVSFLLRIIDRQLAEIVLKANTNYDFHRLENGDVELREWKSDNERGFIVDRERLLGIFRPSNGSAFWWMQAKEVTNEWNYSTKTFTAAERDTRHRT